MKTLTIGLSFWGILADFEQHRFITLDTPDGHRYGRPILVKALQQAGHRVVAMQQRREPEPYPGVTYCLDGEQPDEFPELDVLFLEFRWRTYKNDTSHPDHDPSKYEPDYDRQLRLIEHYKDRCPIIVWDTDLKVTPDDEERWPWLILTDPSMETNRLTRDRASLPFWSDFKQLLPTVKPYPVLGFIGNNYERDDEFRVFYFNWAGRLRNEYAVQTSMYGNWLMTSPEREPPETLLVRHPHVAFNHRMNFYDSLSIMNRFLCTVHVSKPVYYQTGFVSPRYFEALAVGCPGLVPGDMLHGAVPLPNWRVEGSADVRDRVGELKGLTLDQRREVVDWQREDFRRCNRFDVRNVVSFIESVA